MVGFRHALLYVSKLYRGMKKGKKTNETCGKTLKLNVTEVGAQY